MGDLQKIEQGIGMVVRVDKKMIADYLFTSETKLTEKQQMMFLEIALRNNLDPFKREIYAIAYGNEFSIVTGYEVYIQRADTTGQLDGWHCENTEEGAKITIHRKDWDQPFEWEALYDEFDKGQSSWKKMRKFMIKKVCIGQGFRLAFPEVLGGLPYFREEVEGQDFSKQEKPPVQKTQRKSTQKDKPEVPVAKNEEVITVKDVTVKETKKNPKYTIVSGDDVNYGTFDKDNAAAAKAIKGSPAEAVVLFTSHEKWGHTLLDFKDGGFLVVDNLSGDTDELPESFPEDGREPGQEG